MLLPEGLVGMFELDEGSLLSIGAEADEAGLPVRRPEGTPVVLGAPR